MNTPAPPVGSGRRGFSYRPTWLRAAAVALLLGVAALSVAAGPSATDADAHLAVRAKSALAADPQLAGLTLLVSVVDRIAVVGGPVPDARYPARIEAVLRKLPGLADVKVSCWVQSEAGADPLTKMVGDRLKSESPLPSVVVAPRAEPPPAASVPPLTVAARPTNRAVTVQRMAARTGFLLDPVADGGRPITPLPMPAPAGAVAAPGYPTIPPPAVPTGPTDAAALAAQVSALKARDRRFAGLTVALNAGSATVAGRAAHSADAWDFADSVRKLPGVERVILGAVNVR
jgi:hypothetical protein